MRSPADAIIADEKLTRYLLVKRPFDDKSGFLAIAGFTPYNWLMLRQAIQMLSYETEALEDSTGEYGDFYVVKGFLTGPAAALRVKLIWMRRASDSRFIFVTLVPWKE